MAERAPLPLSLFTSEKKKKQQQQARAAPPLPAFRHVILWTLFNAGNIILSVAFATAYDMLMCLMCLFNHPPPPLVDPSWLQSRTAEMTDAEVAVADALALGIFCCAAAQAAAGALALMLPSHRRRLRLLLAYAALVATAAGHSMFAGLHHKFAAAEPGGIWFVNTAAIFIFAVGDLLCFLGLVLRGGE